MLSDHMRNKFLVYELSFAASTFKVLFSSLLTLHGEALFNNYVIAFLVKFFFISVNYVRALFRKNVKMLVLNMFGVLLQTYKKFRASTQIFLVTIAFYCTFTALRVLRVANLLSLGYLLFILRNIGLI